MDSERLQTVIWISAFATLLAAIFMVSSCLQNESIRDNAARSECIAKGGDWSKLPYSTDTYGCQFNK